jgi:hypothetical protein
MQQVGSLKTYVVVSAIAQYLGSAEAAPMSQRMEELEQKVAALETDVRDD